MSALAYQTQAPTVSTRTALLERFFAELDQAEIAYVVLHSHAELPHEIVGNDIDLGVAEGDLWKLPAVIARVARAAGWLVVQRIEHELFASYTRLVEADNPGESVALDVCAHFAQRGALLVPDAVLLKNRHRAPQGFFIPAAAAEFAYLLAKSIAKEGAPGKHSARLHELAAEDPDGAQRNFVLLFGDTGSVENWLAASPNEWSPLRARMLARHRYPLSLRLREWRRRAVRFLRPAGFHIALLGPDGSGKSTLLARIEQVFAPCFSARRVFRFRPDLFHQIEPGLQATPHDREPRGRFVSVCKVLFYFADWWLGLFVCLWPELRRGALLIFDRDFNDLVVDQRRYLVRGVGWLANFLRYFTPRADLTFVLEDEPSAIHARKPELPVEELARQRAAFRRIAATDSRMQLVAAHAGADAVAHQVTTAIAHALADRELRRMIPFSKRVFDVTLALVALVFLWPVIGLLALLVRLKFGAPVIFTQERPGLGEKPFRIWKFRTMPEVRDETGKMLPDVHRLTRFGRLLRSTSLDELPELANVLRGEMSMVGPRPLLMRYLPLYSAEQARRHEMLPGITGWAQINGRNAASWPQKFALDVWYVEHQSLWLDLRIIARTVLTVVKREGINQPGRATADFFRGETGLPATQGKPV